MLEEKLEISEIILSDKNNVLLLMNEFYKSDAMSHPLNDNTILNILDDVLSNKYSVKGYKLVFDDKIVGFSFITIYYATEVNGNVLQFEDIYISPEYRRRGFGKIFIKEIMKKYDDIKRYRLEVMPDNEAKALYEDLGFYEIEYKQLIIDL